MGKRKSLDAWVVSALALLLVLVLSFARPISLSAWAAVIIQIIVLPFVLTGTIRGFILQGIASILGLAWCLLVYGMTVIDLMDLEPATWQTAYLALLRHQEESWYAGAAFVWLLLLIYAGARLIELRSAETKQAPDPDRGHRK